MKFVFFKRTFVFLKEHQISVRCYQVIVPLFITYTKVAKGPVRSFHCQCNILSIWLGQLSRTIYLCDWCIVMAYKRKINFTCIKNPPVLFTGLKINSRSWSKHMVGVWSESHSFLIHSDVHFFEYKKNFFSHVINLFRYFTRLTLLRTRLASLDLVSPTILEFYSLLRQSDDT